MKRSIYSLLASSVFMTTLAFANAQGAHALHKGREHGAHAQRDQTQQANVSRARRTKSKVRSRKARRAISYVCPMHPDMRSRLRGECSKCGMSLVAVGRKAVAASKGETMSAGEEHSKP